MSNIIATVVFFGLVAAVIAVVPRIAQIREAIAPTAPESQPAAANWEGGSECRATFKISLEAETQE